MKCQRIKMGQNRLKKIKIRKMIKNKLKAKKKTKATKTQKMKITMMMTKTHLMKKTMRMSQALVRTSTTEKKRGRKKEMKTVKTLQRRMIITITNITDRNRIKIKKMARMQQSLKRTSTTMKSTHMKLKRISRKSRSKVLRF
jgi:hypothetical protein